MKTDELMIGDWVYNKHHKKNIKLTPYDFFTHGHLTDGTQYFTDNPKLISGNDFEPIPITKEILEKNGFVIKKKWAQLGNFGDSPLIMWHFEDDKFLHDYKNELEIHQNDTGKVHVTVPCEYVHQLQHAMRLCGIAEKIII